MNRKLDVGGTLSQAFSTYGAQAGVLLPVAFVLFLAVAVVTWAVAGSLIGFPIAMAVSIVAGTLYQGMVVGLVSDVQDGRRDSSVGDLVRATGPVVLPLIGAGLLAGLAIGIGLLLILVPGLILLTIWAVIAPAIVVERTGVIEAFGRSRALVRGNGWQVFGVIFTVFVITVIVGIVLGIIGVAISDTAGMRLLFNVISSTLTAPIGALVAAVIYFRLLEIEQEARAAAPPPPAAPPASQPPPSSTPPPPPAPPGPTA
jgi:MFS family permease